MSAREWKPGDVAMLTFRTGDPDALAICYQGGRIGGEFLEMARWRTDSGDDCWSSVSGARRVTVIDPEDAEQVDRVCKVLVEAMHAAGDVASAANGVHPATVAAALREFADPTPRIEEPAAVGSTVIASCPHNSTRGRWIKGFDGNWWPEVRLRYGETERGNRAMPDDWADLVDPEVDPS